MQEPHIEGPATHDDPESCAGAREGDGEALTGARTGAVLSRERVQSGTPTPLSEAEGNTARERQCEFSDGPARSKTRRTCGTSLRENREIPELPAADGAVGRAGKAMRRTPAMYDTGKSDRPVVPTRPPNKAGQPVTEVAEGRGLARGNTDEQNVPRTQSRIGANSALGRVRQVASKDKGTRFTALLHHVNVERLRTAYHALVVDHGEA